MQKGILLALSHLGGDAPLQPPGSGRRLHRQLLGEPDFTRYCASITHIRAERSSTGSPNASVNTRVLSPAPCVSASNSG